MSAANKLLRHLHLRLEFGLEFLGSCLSCFGARGRGRTHFENLLGLLFNAVDASSISAGVVCLASVVV